jgi:uroporphyrinogen-III decarboxylase
MFKIKTQMTPRERILTTLSLKEPDKVPMNLGGFNRHAHKQFKQITGSDEVKQRIETVGTDGGFVISPTHSIAPEVPYENLFAFIEGAKEYGDYCDK